MSLSPTWFEEKARQERERSYPSLSLEDWKRTLQTYSSSISPVGEEAAEWLHKNYSDENILLTFGHDIYVMSCEIVGKPIDDDLISSAQRTARETLIDAKEKARHYGVLDEEVEQIRALKRKIEKALRKSRSKVKRYKKALKKALIDHQQELLDRDICLRYERKVSFSSGVFAGLYTGQLGLLGIFVAWLGSVSFASAVEIGQTIRSVTFNFAYLAFIIYFILHLLVEGALSSKKFRERNPSLFN